jgi:hypothetical protein
MFTMKTRVGGFIASAALATGGLLAASGSGAMGASASASDERAVFTTGNAVNCSQIGFPDDTLAFGNGTDSISDGNVTGQVLPNTALNGGTVDVGNGSLANVQNVGSVTIDAIVTKGGPAYNVYLGPDEVPPALVSPQHYIPPFNPGGHIPTMSHWFICYHGGDTPDVGSLAVTKVIDPFVGPGSPAGTIPTSFTIHVSCDLEGPNVDLTLPEDPVNDPTNLTGVVTDIPDGSTCTVTETTPIIHGQTVTYTPATGDGSAAVVEVGGGEQGSASVENNFTGIDVLPANVTVTPPAADPLVIAPAFTG